MFTLLIKLRFFVIYRFKFIFLFIEFSQKCTDNKKNSIIGNLSTSEDSKNTCGIKIIWSVPQTVQLFYSITHTSCFTLQLRTLVLFQHRGRQRLAFKRASFNCNIECIIHHRVVKTAENFLNDQNHLFLLQLQQKIYCQSNQIP